MLKVLCLNLLAFGTRLAPDLTPTPLLPASAPCISKWYSFK